MKLTNQRRAFIKAHLAGRESIANACARIEAARYEQPYEANLPHDRVSEFNADMWTESFYSQPLTDYAVGFSDDADLEGDLAFFAPEVPVTERFSYHVWDNAEEFLSETDDARAPGADFPEVQYTGTKVDGSVANRGLQITIDYDQVRGMPNWEERYTQKLLKRIKRNELRRAFALLSAAATNTAKTWDTTAGKDPDQDVLSELVTGADISGIRPNRVGYGDTSWSKRILSHRAQNSGGGDASSGMTPDQVRGFLSVDGLRVSQARYTSGASAKTQIVGNKVLMFAAEDGVDTDDFSNIKRFITNGSAEEGGGKYQVYSARISAKRHVIAVGFYSLLKITSTLGIRQFTVG